MMVISDFGAVILTLFEQYISYGGGSISSFLTMYKGLLVGCSCVPLINL